MRNYLLTLVLFLGTIGPIAAQNYRKGSMQIKMRNKQLLTVVIDDRHFAKYGSTLTIADLPPGVHHIKVYEYYPGNSNRYRSFRDKRAHAVLAYRGKIQISPGTMYYCTVDPEYNTMSIRESRTISIDRNDEVYALERDFVFDDEDSEHEYNRPDRRFGNPEQKSNDDDPTLSYYPADTRLSNKEMRNLRDAVEDRTGSADKEKYLMRFLENRTLMTEQVLTMMDWFNFEKNQLSIARFCYPRVLDPENYMEVSRELRFNSSKQELEELIFSYKNNPGNRRPEQSTRRPKGSNNFLQAEEIADLESSIKDKISDTDKQKLMMQFLKENKYTTAQLMSMLDWFTFEGSKLEFCKWSFERITDKENFARVKSKFAFSSSKKSIDDLLIP